MTTAYPLAWPPGWPRTDPRKIVDGRRQFRRHGGGSSPWWTFAAAREALLDELRKLGATNIVVSTNFRLSSYELPHDRNRRPNDEGVAVYCVLNGQPKAMARDTFLRAEENMRSLTLVLEAMRTIERHGGSTMMERAFEGFTALAPPGGKPWWEVLGVPPTAGESMIKAAWRNKAQEAHPDAGGSDAWMAEINAARDAGLKARAGQP